MAVHEHEVSRRANDGSRNDMQDNGYDENRYPSRDQRSPTRTTFFESDIDNLHISERRKDELRRALKRQEGQHVNSEKYDSRGQQNFEEDKRRLIGSFGGQLELTGAQKERVEHLVLDVISVNSFGSYASEQVILATINVVVRENGRWIEDEDMFRELMRQVEIDDLNTMKRLRALVRDRIPSK